MGGNERAGSHRREDNGTVFAYTKAAAGTTVRSCFVRERSRATHSPERGPFKGKQIKSPFVELGGLSVYRHPYSLWDGMGFLTVH